MISIQKATRWDLPALFSLYRSAFPRSERKPFGVIRKMSKTDRVDLWTIRCDGKFAGLAATVNSPDVVLLDYLAVRKNIRGGGVGTGAMAELLREYRGRGLFVEIESTRVKADNAEERQRRKQFYVNCGLAPMDTEAELFGIRMELLGHGCRLNFEEYRNFYRDHYSTWAAEHIRPVKEENQCAGI